VLLKLSATTDPLHSYSNSANSLPEIGSTDGPPQAQRPVTFKVVIITDGEHT